MTDKPRRQIIAGPSREELFDALRLRHESRSVFFTTTHREENQRFETTFKVIVESIRIEDGSGNNWLLELNAIETHNRSGHWYYPIRLKAHFNTFRREGWIRLLDD